MGIQYTKEHRFCVSYRRSLTSFKFVISHTSLAYLLLWRVHYELTNCSSSTWDDCSTGKILQQFHKGCLLSLCFLKLSVFLKFRSFLISWIVQQAHLIEKIIKAFFLLILYGFSLIRLLLIWAYRNHSHEETNLKTTLNGCKRNSILPQIGPLKFPKHMLYFLP